MFNYFIQNKLFTECQSGFIPGDSCVAQLLPITHEICKSFDCNPPYDKRGTFHDISKAFDKVWHKCLTFKLKFYGIDGSLLKLIENYLTLYKTSFFKLLKGRGLFGPRQKNCYKSCLLHPNHLKLGKTYLWALTKILTLVT